MKKDYYFPKSINKEQEVFIRSAIGSCALEGLDNRKVNEKIIRDIASGKSLEERIQSRIEAVKANPDEYFNQFI